METIDLKKPIDKNLFKEQNYYTEKFGLNKLLSIFLYSRFGKTDIKTILNNEFNKIDLLEMEENIEEGIAYYKNGLDANALNKALKIFNEAMAGDKKILFLTDYDCDGINSAVVCKLLTDKYLDNTGKFTVKFNKRKYGNGVNKESIKDLDLNNYSLIITADHGSSSNFVFTLLKDEYKHLKIIVTDHHIIPKEDGPTKADVVINNMSSNILNQNLSGCYTIFFFLMFCINKRKGVKPNEILYEVCEYLAMTILSDVMSAKDPINRYVFKLAYTKIMSGRSTFFNTVMEVKAKTGALRCIKLEDFTFSVCPSINSGNRLHKEEISFKALTEPTEENIELLFKLNNKRIELTKMAMKLIEGSDDLYLNSVCICKINTTFGINGIIAGKLGEAYRRPTICFTKGEDGLLHGSCRSIIPGFDFLEIITMLNEEGLVGKFGGHKEAVGCTVYPEHFTEFVNNLNVLVANALDTNIKDSEVDIDGIIDVEDLDTFDINSLDMFLPFGKNFDLPTFYTEFKIDSAYSSDKIANIKVIRGKKTYTFTAFNNIKVNLKETFRQGHTVGVVIKPQIQIFNRQINMKLLINRATLLSTGDE